MRVEPNIVRSGPVEPLTLGLSAAFLMGLTFGAGPCNVTCLPYLGPVLLAGGEGVRGAWRHVLPFSIGRLSGYAALGVAAGEAGRVAHSWFEGGGAAQALGGAAALLGLYLLLRRSGTACSGRRAARSPMPAGLFVMGAALAFNPCLPLGSVLLAAAATGEPLQGLWLGLAFGAGAVVIPTIVFAVLVAHLGARLRLALMRWQRRLEQAAGGLLLLAGTSTAMGWMQ